MTTAVAPAAIALLALIRKVHAPRETSATLPPLTAGVKSAGLQPVTAPAGAATGPVTEPEPE